MIEEAQQKRWLKKLELTEFPEPEIVRLKHPVLLCHGYGAIASLVKPSPLYDVAMLMRSHNVLAFAPNIVPYAKIETRGENWAERIDRLVHELDAGKLNIIAHSMGGLDIRYALSELDIRDEVASLTTVSTPHRGTSLAELALKTPEAIKTKLADFFDWMGDQVFPRIKSDSTASVEQLTRNYIGTHFNTSIDELEGIPCYSYSAAVGKGTKVPITVITRFQNNHIYEEEGLNDGFVSVESAKWGEHIKTVPLSHMEQMNLRVKEDRRPVFESFWLDVLKMLESKGH